MSNPKRRRWVTREEYDRQQKQLKLRNEAVAFVEAVDDLPNWNVDILSDRELISAYQPLLFKRVFQRYRVEEYFRPLKWIFLNMTYLYSVRHQYIRRKYIVMYLCKVFVLDISEKITQFLFIDNASI